MRDGTVLDAVRDRRAAECLHFEVSTVERIKNLRTGLLIRQLMEAGRLNGVEGRLTQTRDIFEK